MQLFQPPIHIAQVQEFPKEDFITAELSQQPQQPQIGVGMGGQGLEGVLEEGQFRLRLQHQVQVLIAQIVLWYYLRRLRQPAVTVPMLIMVQPLPQYSAMIR